MTLPPAYRSTFRAMGSPCEVQLVAGDDAAARSIAGAIVALVEALEARHSRYRPASVLGGINRVAAVGGTIDVDDETASLLDYAATCHRESGGLFDITSGVLREAWDFASARLPDPSRVAALLPRVGWDKVLWRRPTLRFTVPGMELDLGGIVKEYAADRSAALAREWGATGGLVNLGGDIAIVGPRADGGPWRIGVRDPDGAGAALASVRLRAGALASSGDYERCIVVDGVRYGHLLHPRTGMPVRGLAAVSVTAELCVVAGSAATIAMLKEDDGPAWLAGLGLPHLWVDAGGRIGGSLADGAGANRGGDDA
ncbi:MAG: FAD:protein FMN transferase [Burkholderiales bacterium]|nr:FAD:protein FMN transferase [Burkholderiales bacterium]MCE7875981.1 FAD:protein FMN transferase [Betaproteobacteria bacterium PRO3]